MACLSDGGGLAGELSEQVSKAFELGHTGITDPTSSQNPHSLKPAIRVPNHPGTALTPMSPKPVQPSRVDADYLSLRASNGHTTRNLFIQDALFVNSHCSCR
jgi:hypothetical protein